MPPLPFPRITPEDSGLWCDEQIPKLKEIVDFVHSQGGKIGVQLAHAGRKGSTLAPWVGGGDQSAAFVASSVATEAAGGWPEDVVSASAIQFADGYPMPKEISIAEIQELKQKFVDSVARAKQAGVDSIELHGAHGYLLSSFVSPLSNTRTDNYGGSFENRVRFCEELTAEVRKVWEGPLFYRLSATDWAVGEEQGPDGEWLQWGIEQSVMFAKRLEAIGVDLIE